MENVHKPAKRPWISHQIDLRSFRDEWSSLSYDVLGLTDSRNILLSTVEEKEECRIDNLSCVHEEDIELTKSFTIPPGIELNVLKKQKEELDRCEQDARYKTFAYNNYKYCNYPNIRRVCQNEHVGMITSKTISLPEILLTVEIYRPENSLQRYRMSTPARTPAFVVDQEFCIFGNQYLTELRDVIECISDQVIPGDFSEDPLSTISITCKDLHKSGFFYIDGVFYNDMREETAIDYSKIIIDWSKPCDRGVGPFTSTTMEETQFIDLNIQLGYPYVYVHQGYCEHLIVFSDLRMMEPETDSLQTNDYPMVNMVHPKKRNYCMVCHIHTTKWIVTKNPCLPQEPYFFCDACFFAFNYTEDGEKLGQFEARKYVDRVLIS